MRKNIKTFFALALLFLLTALFAACDSSKSSPRYTYYEDADGDGYGNPNVSMVDTSQPEGCVTDNTDCDDTDADINPGADEVPDDDIDNDCDGLFAKTYCEDADGDGYGNPDVSQVATSQPEGCVTDNTDCDDTDANINPAATEIPNDDIDQDCSGGDLVLVYNVPDDYDTIQEAIEAAVDDYIVLVGDGTYTENINFNGKAITVKSVNGADATTIYCNVAGSVVTFSSSETAASVLDGFTITNGSAGEGGGIYCGDSSPTITNCTISGNSADDGGGIYCGLSSPTITNCTISGNSADNGGGIYCGFFSLPTITNCTITGNSDSGIYCSLSSPTITNCTISGNSADNGGGIYCDNSSPYITNCTISGNSAVSIPGFPNTGNGGGIFTYESSPVIINCTITGNSANDGGGIGGWESSPTITNCTITDNSASSGGGGINCSSSSSPTITGCTITENTANYGGGGIYCWASSSPTITNCTITDNSAGTNGGGIGGWGSSPTITNCTITGNSASSGGGIWCDGVTAITNCTITDNSAGTNGGGIGGWYSSPTITNCTITGNSAGSGGGGIYCGESYAFSLPIVVINSILWGNTAASIGDEAYLYDASSALDISYSDTNAAGIEGLGTTTGSDNLDNADPLFVDDTNTDPLLRDYHLTADSPCIDAGTDTYLVDEVNIVPEDDIDGDARDSSPDMGSDEYIL
jgi:parallel beta-helix repeat protein/predicted outer membrane repeat protein